MKSVSIDAFARIRSLSGLRFSPEGSTACFVVSEGDMKKNAYRSELYTLRDGKPRRLTAGGREESFLFLDEDTVLFPAKREEDEKEKSLATVYYRISLSGGEAEPDLRFPVPVKQLFPLKNGDMLVLGTVFPGFEELYKGDKALEKKYFRQQEEEADYEVVTQNPWWWNGTTFTRGAYATLYYYRRDKKTLEQLTPVGRNISGVKLSPDEQSVYYDSDDAAAPRPRRIEGMNLFRMELGSRVETPVIESRKDAAVMDFWPGDSFLLLLMNDQRHGENTDGDFFRMDYATGEVTPYCPWNRSIGSSVGSDVRHGGGQTTKMVGDTLYFISTVDDSGKLYKLKEGEVSVLLDKEGSVDSFDICGDKLLAVALWDMRPQELYDGKGRRLSAFNTDALRNTYTAKPERLFFSSRGEEIHGFVLKPMGFEPGKKYPVILDIHGGPKTVFGEVYYHEMQYWAGQGYFVIFCNPVGSDGRGDFMDIMGKYGLIDYEDLMAFCDAALAAYPEMDAENFFETGGSYGGYMTNWIIGHTDRFRACASQRSIANWFSFYGVSDIGISFTEDQQLAGVWSDPAALWDRSPMKFADRAVTPTLFIHSFEDYRCPIDQGYQMFTSLVDHGVEAKMVLFRGENHELSRSGKPKHRVRRLQEITDWFEVHKK